MPAEALTSELALSAGNLYMLWLRHIRHRGTFSSMAIAFERFLDIPAIPHGRRIEWLKVSIQDRVLVHVLRPLFLQHQLAFIAKGDAATTRRSGALPYAVLALVHGDSSLFDEAFMGLSDIVRGSAGDSAKIHAMHSIRVMLLDARHSYLFKRYFEESIVISLNAYQTEKLVFKDGSWLPLLGINTVFIVAGASEMLRSFFPPILPTVPSGNPLMTCVTKRRGGQHCTNGSSCILGHSTTLRPFWRKLV